jgi:serine/threonine-protein kinase
MLTGRPPFTDDDAIVVMARHIKTPPKRPIEAAPQANIPGTLDDVVMRILAKEPHQRPGSAEAMSQELARAMSLTATTSGVRPSIPGSNPPPTAGAAVPQIPPSPAVPRVPIPAAPLSDGSLSVLPSSTESLQIAAGVGPSRRKTVIGIAGAVLAMAAVAAVVFGTRAAPSVRAPVVTRDVPAAHDPLIPPVPAAPADTTATTAAAPPTTGRPIPETNVTDLPRAPRAGAPTPPPPPPRARPPSKASPQPSATGTGHYGLFE